MSEFLFFGMNNEYKSLNVQRKCQKKKERYAKKRRREEEEKKTEEIFSILRKKPTRNALITFPPHSPTMF